MSKKQKNNPEFVRCPICDTQLQFGYRECTECGLVNPHKGTVTSEEIKLQLEPELIRSVYEHARKQRKTISAFVEKALERYISSFVGKV